MTPGDLLYTGLLQILYLYNKPKKKQISMTQKTVKYNKAKYAEKCASPCQLGIRLRLDKRLYLMSRHRVYAITDLDAAAIAKGGAILKLCSTVFAVHKGLLFGGLFYLFCLVILLYIL